VNGQKDVSLLIDPFHELLLEATCAVTRGQVVCRRILTDRAKSIIRSRTEEGQFASRTEALEPPFMAPSTEVDHYSRVSGMVYS
jgi:hypothetical protein